MGTCNGTPSGAEADDTDVDEAYLSHEVIDTKVPRDPSGYTRKGYGSRVGHVTTFGHYVPREVFVDPPPQPGDQTPMDAPALLAHIRGVGFATSAPTRSIEPEEEIMPLPGTFGPVTWAPQPCIECGETYTPTRATMGRKPLYCSDTCRTARSNRGRRAARAQLLEGSASTEQVPATPDPTPVPDPYADPATWTDDAGQTQADIDAADALAGVIAAIGEEAGGEITHVRVSTMTEDDLDGLDASDEDDPIPETSTTSTTEAIALVVLRNLLDDVDAEYRSAMREADRIRVVRDYLDDRIYLAEKAR
jgi:hypothetical protein